MINKDSIESAYCFLHQKYRVYEFSNSETQRDDIEFAIASYVNDMNKELYAHLAKGRKEFLCNHTTRYARGYQRIRIKIINMDFDKIQDDTRKAELIRIIEHSVERLSLAELEALYYDLVSKDYIR